MISYISADGDALLLHCGWASFLDYTHAFNGRAVHGLEFLLSVVGWLASLSIAGYMALTVRKIVKTEMVAAEPMTKPSPFSSVEVWTWTAIFILSFALAFLSPMALGMTARTRLPFLLAATVLGYMVGSG
ncbi:plastidal glycolate/glycerate translocator 1, chloroplastic-like isoform X3 [Magnolia sinica]|uniref:plastidal glycolate/glycerate translocator 1, chloroplastic-like isoform X3 n=1 Tax=Magnolia sinica TaxID=86752 RepID=UPI00265B3295|nr:plastidal glycolate/glycerate translocator 1, chloroplastic-like isoform X3 [Magnolia sinica]XP_058077982.1 plastidal glycolate/glycerate translocator 1, chloroplastic-like isoform X3 [Magnolia sinica]